MNNNCIYCGRSAQENIIINDSDIVPASLTNEKLKNNNVCSIEHNNKFGETFESDVINALARVRNHLNIKSHGGKYPQYDVLIEIDGELFKQKITSEDDIIGNGIISSLDGSARFGNIEKIQQFSNFKEQNLKIIDINNIEIEIQTLINLGIYHKRSMKRLIAKIAYEWHCKLDEINNYDSMYTPIISYITNDEFEAKHELVNLITDNEIYKHFNKYFYIGNHLLIRIKKKGKIYVYISLFGIAIYEVIVGECESLVPLLDLKELGQAKNIRRIKDKTRAVEEFIKLPIFSLLLNYNHQKKGFDNIANILIQNTSNLLNQTIITKELLQRFVLRHKLSNAENLSFNFKNIINSDFWNLLGIVYNLGEYESDNKQYDWDSVQKIIFKNFNPSNFSINDIKEMLKNDKDYKSVLTCGAEIILKIFD